MENLQWYEPRMIPQKYSYLKTVEWWLWIKRRKKTVFTKMINRKPFSLVFFRRSVFYVSLAHATNLGHAFEARAPYALLDNCVATIICETTHEKRLVLSYSNLQFEWIQKNRHWYSIKSGFENTSFFSFFFFFELMDTLQQLRVFCWIISSLSPEIQFKCKSFKFWI